MTKAEEKAARHRRASREWMRRYRARKAEETDKNEQFDFVPPAPSVILPQTRESQIRTAFQHRPAPSAASLPESTPAPSAPTRLEPILFNTAQDKFRPSWWSDVDTQGAVIQLGFGPRAVRRSPPIAVSGRVQTPVDPGIVFSEDAGHIDIAAETAQRAQEADRKQGDHRSWKSGQEENE